jgi:hypothetical protein
MLVQHALSGSAQDSDGRDDLLELAEAIEALDDWITRGGFRPDDWA